MSTLPVAVIVPVYNRAKMVVEALGSIAAQTRRPDRVIVVDDGSTDGSGDAVEKWSREGGAGLDVRLIRQTNQGASIARNRAAEEARDLPLMAFLDSDDLWPPDYLARVATAMEREPAAVAATVDQHHVDFSTGESFFYDMSIYDGTITAALIEPQMPPVPSCTIIRAKHFFNLGGFDPAYVISQDRHFFLRLSLLGPWRYVRGLPITYRRNLTAAHQGAAQLTERFASLDETETWWTMVRRFVFEQGGVAVLKAAEWRRRIAGKFVEIARMRMRLTQHDRAIAALNVALALRPGHVRARRLRSSARWKQWFDRWRNRGRRPILTTPCPANPRIAVVLPVYNRAAVVIDALDCIVRQTLRPAKVVVVDDGSTDDTAERIEAWIQRHRGEIDIELIRQPNGGTGAARTRGVAAAAACDLLAFLDSDDLWPADFLQRTSAALIAAPDAVAANIDIRFYNALTGLTCFFDQSRFDGWVTRILFDLMMRLARNPDTVSDAPPMPLSTLYRAEAFHRAGGFDPRWRVRSDMDINLRISTLGPWVHVRGEPSIYRRHLAPVLGGAEQLTDGLGGAPQRVVGWQLLAHFLMAHGRAAGLPVARLRLQLMRATRTLGINLVRLGRHDLAAQCMAVAEQTAPWYRFRLRGKLRQMRERSAKLAPAPPPPHQPVIRRAEPPRGPASAFNALDYFHKIKDRYLDKEWGYFVIPIDSARNDIYGGAPFRHQNLYLDRFAMPYKSIEGWFGYWGILDEIVAGAKDGDQFIELGTAWGCATIYLASKIKASGKQIRHCCVDLWQGETDYQKFRENLRLAQVQGRVQAMRMSFASAARHFEDASLDFIFVDGGHEYEDVIDDIKTWWPKLKPGGVMAGDDWCDQWPGVERAVRELLPQARFVPTHFWMVRKE